MRRLSFQRKVLSVFCGLTLLPLIVLVVFAAQSLDTVEQLLRSSAIEALDNQAAETLELRAVLVADEVRTFLHRVESDLDVLAHLPVEEERYLWFNHNHQSPIWVRTDETQGPRELRPLVRLYREIAYIDPDGQERLRIVDGAISSDLRDVSQAKNTTYLTETYFNDASKLAAGEIYVSHVTGWHINKVAQLAGAKTPEEAVGGASYVGVVRFAKPVFDADGMLEGVVVLSLDHQHLMEFTQHITPTEERFVVFPSYQSGNYAFMFDNEGWIITHPKFWDIRGLDREGRLVAPYTEHSTQEEIARGDIPYNLAEAAFIHPNYPEVYQAILGGRSGVVDVTNVGGSEKIMAFAPIFYDSGPYRETGVFGGITIGAEVKQFHSVAEAASENIRVLYKAFLTGAWVMIAMTGFLVVFVAYRLARNITSPLSTLISGTQEMARGKMGTQVKIESPVEVAELASSFNKMATQLAERRERLLKTLGVLRRSRKEIKRERDFKQTIFENVEVGILTLDSDGYVTSLNGVARVLLKNDQPLPELTPLKDVLENYPELFAAVSTHIESERWSEYVPLEREGRPLTYRMTVHPLSAGGEGGHILTIEDLTERVSFRQRMARFERLASLGRLSAGIAHEVRNPLTGISLLLDELHDRLLENPEDQGLIQRALQEIERLEGLVNELLNFASLPDTRLAPGDLAALLRDTLFLVSKQFQKQHVRLHEEIPDALQLSHMDSDRLKQAILNLLTNALDAMPDGGELWIAASRTEDDGALLTIRDTGAGIPADRIALIFEPFYTTKGEGTGLGLSITHTIITSHGGRIEVKSKEGEGTEFKVYLPKNGQN